MICFYCYHYCYFFFDKILFFFSLFKKQHSEIGKITALQRIDFTDQSITGTIPTE